MTDPEEWLAAAAVDDAALHAAADALTQGLLEFSPGCVVHRRLVGPPTDHEGTRAT